jgi:hypothetical protein
MKATFLFFGPDQASSRFRAMIPWLQLQKYGVKPGKDILIASKHGYSWDITEGYKKIIFDICDDHFNDKWGIHYRRGCELADAIVCNSEAMQLIIKEETGRDAFIIEDPYEDDEHEPAFGDSLLWFGHSTNFPDLARVIPTLDRDVELQIVSNIEGATQWTPQSMDLALKKCGMVIIPTGKSVAKSANRMIKALRYGRFVVAEPLPAHHEIEGPWLGTISKGIKWAIDNPQRVLDRIRQGQDSIRERFSPETIGKKWLEALSSLT